MNFSNIRLFAYILSLVPFFVKVTGEIINFISVSSPGRVEVDCDRSPEQNVLFSSDNFPGSYSKGRGQYQYNTVDNINIYINISYSKGGDNIKSVSDGSTNSFSKSLYLLSGLRLKIYWVASQHLYLKARLDILLHKCNPGYQMSISTGGQSG